MLNNGQTVAERKVFITLFSLKKWETLKFYSLKLEKSENLMVENMGERLLQVTAVLV